MEQNTIVGGWSAWSFTPTKEAQQVFSETMGKLLGVRYKLVAFASQLVNGTNYAFLCEAEAVTLSHYDYVVVGNVYQPIKGQPHITGIRSVGPKPAGLMGGWQSWQFSVTGKAKAIFAEATKHLIGVGYKALGFTSQVVNGTNYCYLSEATIPGPTPYIYPALIWIYQPLQGDPHVEEIQRIEP